MQRVFSVDPGGIAARYGIVPGDEIMSINGEQLIDEIDYQALAAGRHLTLQVRKADGSLKKVE